MISINLKLKTLSLEFVLGPKYSFQNQVKLILVECLCPLVTSNFGGEVIRATNHVTFDLQQLARVAACWGMLLLLSTSTNPILRTARQSPLQNAYF